MSSGFEGSDRRARLPKDWPKRRARVLQRDRHQCTWIEDDVRCIAPATDVDHVIAGDNHDEANLQSLCEPHHARKTAAEGNAARHRHKRRRPEPPHPGLEG